MSGGGGKGGESRQSIDPRLAAASEKVLNQASEAAKIPYSPNRGVTIAAFTPQQEAAMKNASNAASAFGLEGGASPSMPEAETNAMGIKGYSTGKIYDEMVNKSLSPELQAAIDKFFINRKTGQMGGASASSAGAGADKKGTSIGMALSNTLGLNKKGGGEFKPRDHFGGLSKQAEGK